MNLEQAAEILQKWAREGDIVNRLWLYGSRVPGSRRDPRLDSDLDVAIEVLWKGREDPYTRFFFDHKKWEASLDGLFPFRIHLAHYNPSIPLDVPVEEGNVRKEVDRYGILVYERTSDRLKAASSTSEKGVS